MELENDKKSSVYDETMLYFEEHKLKPQDNLAFLRFRVDNPNLDLNEAKTVFEMRKVGLTNNK